MTNESTKTNEKPHKDEQKLLNILKIFTNDSHLKLVETPGKWYIVIRLRIHRPSILDEFTLFLPSLSSPNFWTTSFFTKRQKVVKSF